MFKAWFDRYRELCQEGKGYQHALTTIQRERGEDDTTDMLCNCRGFVKDGFIIRI